MTRAAVRTSALIALGAFAVHQLRYLGHDGGGSHGYLETVLPVLIGLAASSILGTVVAALLTGRTTAHARTGWTFCATALLVIFVAQETAEGLLSSGHFVLLGHGGWIAVPIAIAVGRVVSLLLSGLGAVERKLVGARTCPTPRAPVSQGRTRSRQTPALAGRPLAFGLARRPPPLLAP